MCFERQIIVQTLIYRYNLSRAFSKEFYSEIVKAWKYIFRNFIMGVEYAVLRTTLAHSLMLQVHNAQTFLSFNDFNLHQAPFLTSTWNSANSNINWTKNIFTLAILKRYNSRAIVNTLKIKDQTKALSACCPMPTAQQYDS